MSVTGLYVQDEPEFLRSFERKRERQMVKMHRIVWMRETDLSSSLFSLRYTLSLSLVWLYPAESLEMEQLCSGWDSKAMSHYISKCTTSIHCAVVSGGWDVWMRCGVWRLYRTVASMTMAGSSMSALLWTIRNSSWAGLGLLPGPAISENTREIIHSHYCLQFRVGKIFICFRKKSRILPKTGIYFIKNSVTLWNIVTI